MILALGRVCLCSAAVFLASLALTVDAQQSSDASSSAASPAPPQRVRVSQGVAQRLLVKKVQPEYPSEAKKKHVQGIVLIQFVISKAGEVTEPQVISGNELLVPSALAAFKQWRYRSYMLNGQPVEVEAQATIVYRLSQ